MKRLNLLVLVCTCCLLGSCASIVPFTDNIAAEVGGETQLKNFQYYVSRTIVMNRVEDTTDANLVAGKANLVRVVERDKIDIKESTPGIVITHARNNNLNNQNTFNLGVAFGESDDNLLRFKRNGGNDPKYYIVTEKNDWVNYGGIYYKYSTPSKRKWGLFGEEKKEPAPYLMIKLNKKLIQKQTKRTEKGRKLQ